MPKTVLRPTSAAKTRRRAAWTLRRRKMEVAAGVEVALQFAGFKNVDLFSQGIYQLRVSAHGARSGRAAVPFAVLEAPAEASGAVPSGLKDREPLLPAHILDATGEFCTCAFRVRYMEEEILLRSIARLRADLSFLPPEAEEPGGGGGRGGAGSGIEELVISIKLMHARSTTTFEAGDAADAVEAQSLAKFKLAQVTDALHRARWRAGAGVPS